MNNAIGMEMGAVKLNVYRVLHEERMKVLNVERNIYIIEQ